MSISGILAVIPSRRTILTVVMSSLLGGAAAIGVSTWLGEHAGPSPSPQPPHDPQFVRIGRAYLPELGKAYATAWEEGAKSLDAGQPLSGAIAAVAKAWNTNRSELIDRLATPEFAKVVPESTKDADVTPQQRAAMASAWRGLALGLRK
jgi:hypothetical protein